MYIKSRAFLKHDHYWCHYNFFLKQMSFKVNSYVQHPNKTIILENNQRLCLDQSGRIFISSGILDMHRLLASFSLKQLQYKKLIKDLKDQREKILLHVSFNKEKSIDGLSKQLKKTVEPVAKVRSAIDMSKSKDIYFYFKLKKIPFRLG